MERNVIYEFGTFRLNPRERQLLRDGKPVSLTPQLFSLLLAFLENSGHLLSKEELRNKVWGDAFVSENALKVIVGNLRKVLGDGQNGDRYIENVRAGGYRFVASVETLTEQPSARSELPEDEQATPIGDSTPHVSHPKAKLKRATILASLVLITSTLLVAAHYWRLKQRADQDRRASGLSEELNNESSRKSLAVLGFKNLSRLGDKEWLGTALTEMLTTELAAGEGVRVVPPDRVARAKRELSLNDIEGSAPTESLGNIRKNLNVDLIMVGAYTVVSTPQGAEIRLDIRIQDARTGEPKIWKSFVGREDNLFGLISDAGRRLRNDLGLSDLTPEQAAGLRSLFPSHPRAAALYAEGLNRLRFSDSLQARSIFEHALKIQPDHPLIHAALANALSNLGYETLAQQEGKLAVSLARDLPLEQRLSVEGQYRSSTREWDKAVEVYETLFKYLPEQLDYGLQLAKAQVSAGKSRDALATVTALRSDRKLPDDGRIDLAEAYAALPLAELRQAQKAARIAETKGANRGAQFLVAEALLVEADADRNLGEIPDAVKALEKARQIYTTMDDKTGIGRTLVIQGSTIRDVAPLLSRKQMYEDAISIFKEIGDQSDKARALNALGGVYEDMGDLEISKSNYEQSLAIRRETGEDGWAAVTINNLGTLYGIQGDLRRAKEKYEEALAITQRLGGKAGIALCTGNIAGILSRQGNLDAAKSKYEESLTLYRELGAKANVADLLSSLGDISFVRGDLVGAMAHYGDALAVSKSVNNNVLRATILVKVAKAYSEQAKNEKADTLYIEALGLVQSVGSDTVSAEVNLSGAELFLNEGRFAGSQERATLAIPSFQKQGKLDSLIRTYDLTAQSLLGENKCNAAKRQLDVGRGFAMRTQDPTIRLSFQVTEWRVRAQCGHASADAKAGVEKALSGANGRQLFNISLYARTALIEIASLEGKIDSASLMIDSTSRDAISHGFIQGAKHIEALRAKK